MLDKRLILNTKLFVPSIRQNQIVRDSLNTKLDESYQKKYKIILVSAPAGYGKTTLISAWINRISVEYTWLSLDEYDNDPIRFIFYLIAAIKKIKSSFGALIDDLLASPKLPRAEIMGSYIIKEIELIENPFILALDDYHCIHDSYIHELMQKILDAQELNMTLVLLTRQDPPLSLSRWRARDRMFELRTWDLKFEAEDIKAFYSNNFKMNFNDEMIEAIFKQTEGWIAGMHLIGLSLKNMGESQARSFIDAFKGNNRYIIEYLLEEVMERQDDQIRDFLIRTGMLKRFNSELCDAVLGIEGSKSIIEQLEKDNLFIVPLDNSRTWHRYHHLFSEFLRLRSNEHQKAEIYRKVIPFLRERGFNEEALEYALESKDGDSAESLILQEAVHMIDRGEVKTLLSWLNAVKSIKENSDVMLDTYRAWCLFLTSEINEAFQVIKSLENKQIKDHPLALGGLKTLASVFYVDTDKNKGLEHVNEAVVLFQGKGNIFYNAALWSLGHVKFSFGQVAEAALIFREIYEGKRLKANRFTELSALASYSICLNILGRRKEALALCLEALTFYTNILGSIMSIAQMLYSSIGFHLYTGNELQKARYYLQEGINTFMELELSTIIGHAAVAYIQLLHAEGETKNALQTMQRFNSLSKSNVFRSGYTIFEAMEIEMTAREKSGAELSAWLKEHQDLFDDIHCPYYSYAQLTYIRVLIMHKMFDEAQSKLLMMENSAREYRKHGLLISILVLQGLVKKQTGNEKAALDYIGEALILAAPEGYVRSFLGEDPEVLELVRKMRDVAPEFVDLLISNETSPTRPSISTIKPLKDREIEILGLIASGLSNKQIAAKLFLTTGTIKWYIKNIYEKLGVNRRTQAVRKGRQLNIIL